jgi:hypothetical protein
LGRRTRHRGCAIYARIPTAIHKSGRAIIEALIAGETNPAKLASLADRRVKASQEELREALRGRVRKQHRFLLRLHLNQIDSLATALATIDAQVEENLWALSHRGPASSVDPGR